MPPRSGPVISPDEPASIHMRISRVADSLARSFQVLLESQTGRPIHARSIEKTYGLNKVFCHRLAGALRCGDPLGTLHKIPGPEPLRRLVEAALAGGAAPELLAPAAVAVDEFEDLIRRVAGDRSGLDAILSSWMPKARSRLESEAKQLVFRGMRQLKGVAADVTLYAFLLHPSEDGERFDFVQLHGQYGLRCIRPGASLNFGVKSYVPIPSSPAAVPRTLDGEPVQQEGSGLILERFCSGPPLRLKLHDTGNLSIVYSLDWGEAVGMESARDIVTAELRRNALRRWREPDDPRPRAGNAQEIYIPTRLYINDLLMHKDVYPDWVPSVRILETGELGSADANDPVRDLDVIDVQESIEPLGTGIHRYRVEEIPNYAELLEYVFKQVGWDPSEFRAYRTRIDYPIFASQIQHRWDLPAR